MRCPPNKHMLTLMQALVFDSGARVRWNYGILGKAGTLEGHVIWQDSLDEVLVADDRNPDRTYAVRPEALERIVDEG